MSGPCQLRYVAEDAHGWPLGSRVMKCWNEPDGRRALQRKSVRKCESYSDVGFVPAPKFEFVVRSVRTDGDGEVVERRQRFSSRRAAKKWARWATRRHADTHVYSIVDTRPKRPVMETKTQLAPPHPLRAITQAPQPMPIDPPKPVADISPSVDRDARVAAVEPGDTIICRHVVSAVTESAIMTKVGDAVIGFDRDEILDAVKVPPKRGDTAIVAGNKVSIAFVEDGWAMCWPYDADAATPFTAPLSTLRRVLC